MAPRAIGAGRRHKVFCRRKLDCQSSVCDAAMMRHNRLLAAYCELVARCMGNCCDNCFLPCRKVHCCTNCFTKAWCSTACYDADSAAHQRFCRAGAPARKVNAGQSGGKEQGTESLDHLAERVASCGLDERTLAMVEDVLQQNQKAEFLEG